MPDSRPLLAPCTTFQLGGPCRELVICRDPETLKKTLRTLINDGTPYVLIGGGSNLLVSDAGVDAVIVRYFSDDPILEISDAYVEVSGSTILDHLVRAAMDCGLRGVTMCSGIPGTVGGAVVGNAGAFGKQIGDVLDSVELMNGEGEIYRVPASELNFAYRRSRLQESGEVVLSARIRWAEGDRAAMLEERESILALRREKHPDWHTEPCIGSIFRNVEPTSVAERRQSAGWFLEQAGAKALRVGGAFVCPKHANIIIKGEDGTADDVYELSQQMARAVRDRFSFELEREVRFLGRFSRAPGMPENRFF